MGGLGDHAGEMIYILLAILLIVAVMVTVMSLSKSSKKSTNQKVNELGQQVGNVDNQFFEEWDQGHGNGTQLKQFMQSAKDKDCAVLVTTLSLLGAQPSWDGVTAVLADGAIVTKVAETTFNGTALADCYKTAGKLGSQLPAVKVSLKDANNPHKVENGAFVVQTALGTRIKTPVFINYGSLLKNSVKQSGADSESYQSILEDSTGTAGKVGKVAVAATSWDTATDTAQEIAYADGRFMTKSEFAVSQSGQILRYDSTLDWSSSGKAMYIDDNAQFSTYVLTNAAGKYLGVIWVEQK